MFSVGPAVKGQNTLLRRSGGGGRACEVPPLHRPLLICVKQTRIGTDRAGPTILDLGQAGAAAPRYKNVMSVSSFQQDGYDEFRWTIATVAALTCCAVLLAAAIVVTATGDRFEYRPAASELSRYDDELVRSFEALQATEAARQNLSPRGTENPQASGAAASETNAKSSPSGAGDRKAAGAPKRRVAVRLKSPWCTGVLRHQPFRSCRPRPQ